MANQIPPKNVWWILWIALFVSTPAAALVLPSALSSEPAEPLDGIMAWVFVLPAVAALLVRLIAMPTASSLQRRWVLFVMGVALSEGVVFIAVFMSSENLHAVALALAMILMALFCPLFLKIEPDDSPAHPSTAS